MDSSHHRCQIFTLRGRRCDVQIRNCLALELELKQFEHFLAYYVFDVADGYT